MIGVTVEASVLVGEHRGGVWGRPEGSPGSRDIRAESNGD